MEKPILFKTEMVQAILAGRKTMTRRIIKPQPNGQLKCVIKHETKGRSCWMEDNADQLSKDFKFHKSYEVGDVLWVRETWAQLDMDYRAVEGKLNGEEFKGCPIAYKANNDAPEHFGCWRPSIFMPRTAARLLLKVKDIRVERLQDITEGDARSEGIEWTDEGPLHAHYLNHNLNASLNFKTSKEAFSSLWDSINKSRGFSWDSNPYVWIISFERVEGK